MKTDTLNSKTAEMSITSNCSIIETLNRPPYSLISGNGVCYSYYDFDGEVFVEHKIKSETPLTQTDIDVLDFLLERVDSDGKIQMTGKELFDRFGRSGKVFDSVLAIKNIDILNKITHAETQRSVYHRFGVIKSFTENQNCSNWQELRDDTAITITLYERFADVYLDHTISDLNLTIDDKKDDKKDADDELAEIMSARTGKPDEEEQPVDEENEEGEESEEEEKEEKDEEEENEEEINDAGDSNESIKEENSQNKIYENGNVDILISVRQLKRMFNDDHDDDDFYMSEDGYLVKYRGQGKEDVVIPNGAFLIGNSAFEGCSELKSVKIPNTVKIICKDAFKDCVNLEEVEMPLDMLKLMMPNIDFCFSGTPISEMLKKGGLFLEKYKVEIKAKRIEEATDNEEKEEDNESEEGNMDGEKDENEKEKDDNGGGATTEKP